MLTDSASGDILEMSFFLKIVKNSLFFSCFVEKAFLDIFDVSMVVLSQSPLSFDSFQAPCFSKWEWKWFETVIKD